MDLKTIQKELKKKGQPSQSNANTNKDKDNLNNNAASHQQLQSSILTYGPRSRMTGRNRHGGNVLSNQHATQDEHIEWSVHHSTNGRSRSKKPLPSSPNNQAVPINSPRQLIENNSATHINSPITSPTSKRAALALATPSWAGGLRSPIEMNNSQRKRSRSNSNGKNSNNNNLSAIDDGNPFGPATYGEKFNQYQTDVQRRNDENNNIWTGNEATWNQSVGDDISNQINNYNPFLPVPAQVPTTRGAHHQQQQQTLSNHNRPSSSPRSSSISAPTRSSSAKHKGNSHSKRKSKSPSYQYHSHQPQYDMPDNPNYNQNQQYYNQHNFPNYSPSSLYPNEYSVQSHPIHSLTNSPPYHASMHHSSHPNSHHHQQYYPPQSAPNNAPLNNYYSNQAPSPLLKKSLSPEEMASIDAQVARALQSMDLSRYVEQSSNNNSNNNKASTKTHGNNSSTPKSRSFKSNNDASSSANTNPATQPKSNPVPLATNQAAQHQYYYNADSTQSHPKDNNKEVLRESSTPFDDEHQHNDDDANANDINNESTVVHADKNPFVESDQADNQTADDPSVNPVPSPKSVSFSSNLQTHHEYNIPTPDYQSEDEDIKKAKKLKQQENKYDENGNNNNNNNSNDQTSNRNNDNKDEEEVEGESHYQYVYEPSLNDIANQSSTSLFPELSDTQTSLSSISSAGSIHSDMSNNNNKTNSTGYKHPLSEQSSYHRSLFGIKTKSLFIQVLSIGIACVDVMLNVDKYPIEDTQTRLSSAPYERRGGNSANLSSILVQLNSLKYSSDKTNNNHKIDISLVTTLGSEKDHNTNFIIQSLENEGIDCNNLIIHPSHPSPISYIINSSSITNSRTIMHYRGNLPEVSITDFHRCLSRIFTPPLVQQYNYPYNSQQPQPLSPVIQHHIPDYMWLHFEGRNIDQVERMIQTVRGIRESKPFTPTNVDYLNELTPLSPANPSMTNYFISLEVEKPRPHIETLWPLVDVLFFSQEYAQHYLSLGVENTDPVIPNITVKKPNRSTSNSPSSRSPSSSVNNNKSSSPKRISEEEALKSAANFVKIVANKLSHLLVRPIIVCTWGSSGSVCLDFNNILTYCPAGHSAHIYNTVGAGDTFIASYIFSCLQGASSTHSLQFASKIALLKISNKSNELPRAATSAAIAKLVNDMKNHRNKYLKKQRSNNNIS